MKIIAWLKRRFCKHRCYLEDMVRRDDGKIVCVCHKCGKQLMADYGLALSCEWDRRPKVEAKRVIRRILPNGIKP